MRSRISNLLFSLSKAAILKALLPISLLTAMLSEASAADGVFRPLAELPGKIEEVKDLVEMLVNDGYDPSPVLKVMEKVRKAVEVDRDPAEAERQLDEAIEVAQNRDDLKRPRPAGKPAQIQARLEGKVRTLQELVAVLLAAGKNPAGIQEKMKDFESNMKDGEVLKAEKLLDEAIDLAKDGSGSPGAADSAAAASAL